MSSVRYEFAAIVRRDESGLADAYLPELDGSLDRFKFEPSEEEVGKFYARGMSLYRGQVARGHCYYSIKDLDVEVTLTDRRIVVLCRKFTKGGGWWGSLGLMVLANAISKALAANRRRGKVLAGQMRLEWLQNLGYQPKQGWASENLLQLVATDGSDQASVIARFVLDKKADAAHIAATIRDAAVAQRLQQPERLDPTSRMLLDAELPFAPLPGSENKWQVVQVPGAVVVSPDHSLTAPTAVPESADAPR